MDVITVVAAVKVLRRGWKAAPVVLPDQYKLREPAVPMPVTTEKSLTTACL